MTDASAGVSMLDKRDSFEVNEQPCLPSTDLHVQKKASTKEICEKP